jgi:hypothetical protein
MQSFISDTLDDILLTTKSFENAVFILPSQRAKVFVKQACKDKISVGFLPEIITIEQLIQQISEIEKAENIQLLFHFYEVYKSIEKNPDSFDVFASWAFTVLQDFNEIDQHLVDAKDIFIYIRDIERLKKWSVKGTFSETELIKNHHSFLEKLQEYYTVFYQLLLKQKSGYQGMLYRESCKKIDEFLEKNNQKKFFFIGFNALNKAEEFLFQKIVETNNAFIYWDIDETFLNSNHQAGNFMRKYKNSWKYFEKNPFKTPVNIFSSDKNIQIIGAAKSTTQQKYIAEILENSSNVNNTALVLADETLLPIALNSLPKNVNGINITMGYPLKDVPASKLFLGIFQLFLTQQKLQKTGTNQFYYKDCIRVLKHPFLEKFISNSNYFFDKIIKENTLFISQKELEELLKFQSKEAKKISIDLFQPFSTIHEFIETILTLIFFLKEKADALEKEYLFRFYTVFSQLKSLNQKFSFFTDLKVFAQFFKQLIATENLSFQGEPLNGLQLMGMLETRVLDFETIILASANEGILPASKQQTSFIPFDVKIAFDLPTYKEKDAIFSYHFFRLLQRAKTIFILYNTEQDHFGSGEKSRFITQLEMMKTGISHKIITPKVISKPLQLKEVSKNIHTNERLIDLAKKGISPSTITSYLYNPIQFYKQKVLKIKEFTAVEETIAHNTLGTVVHETLDELYKPFIGKFLKSTDITEMEKITKDLVIAKFSKHFINGNILTGKNRLIFEVANRFVSNFLEKEKELLQNEKNHLKIIATEQNLETEITIDGFDFPFKIYGNVDRIDELNGVVRIIDYKTGKVTASNLKAVDFDRLKEEKFHKAVQVMMYAFLFTKSSSFDFSKPLQAGIYSFKNLNAGFLQVNFALPRKPKETLISLDKLNDFQEILKTYIKEIYNPEVSFLEPPDLKY